MADISDIRERTREVIARLVPELSEIELRDLEVGVYNYAISYASENKIPLNWYSELFQEVYLAKARNVATNLKSDSYVGNQNLLTRMSDKEFLPHALPFMTNDQVYPAAWKQILDRAMMRNKVAYEVTQVSMSDQIKCGKCKKNKVSYIELQLRSADEPMSQLCTCLICGHRWKM